MGVVVVATGWLSIGVVPTVVAAEVDGAQGIRPVVAAEVDGAQGIRPVVAAEVTGAQAARARVAAASSAAAAAALAVASVPPGDGAAQHHGHPDTANGKPDRVITGPQGTRGQFVVECPLSHQASDDPIVHHGRPGASHLHQFFGNVTTDASSTVATMTGRPTTCDQPLDTASYWAPALFDGDRQVVAVKSTAYYRAGLDMDPRSVRPYPLGLMMIAGNAAATVAQPVEVVAWTCGTGGLRAAVPPACSPDRVLRVIITFPDCWNGTDLDAADHRAHVSYSHRGQCPPSHPVPVPQLQFSVEYDHHGPTTGLRLASGPIHTAHADFFNVWDPDKLATEVSLCIHRDIVCGITSGRRTG